MLPEQDVMALALKFAIGGTLDNVHSQFNPKPGRVSPPSVVCRRVMDPVVDVTVPPFGNAVPSNVPIKVEEVFGPS
mgnify:CR=1 FL=1